MLKLAQHVSLMQSHLLWLLYSHGRGPINPGLKCMWTMPVLLVVDTFSKWAEIHMTSSSTSATTFELMRNSFASLGLPELIVSDNATTFTSEEFQTFLKKNGVKRVRTAPYHPSSNGLALKKQEGRSFGAKLACFLSNYRIKHNWYLSS